MADHAHQAEHGHHRNYVAIWGILVALLVVSVVGPMTGIRVVMLITAFGVACVKAYMVAKNFMHLDVEKPIVHWMMIVGVTLMVLFFAGVSPDVMKDHGRRWVKGPGFHPIERVGHEGMIRMSETGTNPGISSTDAARTSAAPPEAAAAPSQP